MKLLKKTTTGLALALSLTAQENETTTITPPQSLLSFVETKDATGDVKKIYDEIKAAWGFVPIVLKQYSLSPELLKNQWEFYKITGKNKNFDDKMQTMMRMLIAGEHNCVYCVGFNEGMLLNMFKMPFEELKALKKDATTAKLDEKQKSMLLFILKSVNDPHKVDKTDIDALKKLGWTDKDIFEGVKLGTNMVSVSLLIDALKIQKDY
jgi:uncharacterized peroxidase-related enzyme